MYTAAPPKMIWLRVALPGGFLSGAFALLVGTTGVSGSSGLLSGRPTPLSALVNSRQRWPSLCPVLGSQAGAQRGEPLAGQVVERRRMSDDRHDDGREEPVTAGRCQSTRRRRGGAQLQSSTALLAAQEQTGPGAGFRNHDQAW